MLSIFGSKTVHPDLSFLGADMHSHLLPGIDDGLKELDQTLIFVKELHQLGYSKLICTPHIMSDLYPNTPETILSKLAIVRNALLENNIPVQIEAAAEYMVDNEMEKYLRSEQQLLTFGDNFILVEMSFLAPSPNIEQVVFDLKMKGFQPVLAHPERYGYYHARIDMYERFIDLGCMMQVNLLSLLGYYGKPVKTVAEKLIKNSMVDFLGTDMHHEGHLAALKELAAKKEFCRLFGNINWKNKELL